MSITQEFILPKRINLIGLLGKARAGKDTIATYINAHYSNAYTEYFAGPLKSAASTAFGIPDIHFYSSALKEVTDSYWNVSPRMIAQFMGTEMFRDTLSSLIPDIGNNFWVRRLHGKLSGELLLDGDGEYEDGDTVCVADLRFQNEYNWIISNGGIIIEVTREGADGSVGIANHPSENGITMVQQGVHFDVTNNSSFGDLYNQIDTILKNQKQFEISLKS